MRGRDDRGARESRLASGWTVEGTEAGEAVEESDPAEAAAQGAAPEAEIADAEAAADDESRPQFSAGMLVLLGVLGGLFLLYTIVWFSWAKYYTAAKHDEWVVTMGSFGAVLQTILFWVASAAPALWFLTALSLNRGGRIRNLMIWILIGAILLMPLPMFAGGAS